MTEREQRRRRRELRAMRRRAAGMLARLVLLVSLVFIVAVRAQEQGDEPDTAAEPEPLISLKVTETAYIETTAETPSPTLEPEPISRYSGIEITDEDAYTLACLVYHEARGEPLEGQIAVVEVVLNRCLSDYFPDTVSEVVFQKYGDVWQFSPAPYLYTAEPTETQYEAVHTAIAAEEPILPLDTVYFSTGPYNDSIVAVIGNHYFCSIF